MNLNKSFLHTALNNLYLLLHWKQCCQLQPLADICVWVDGGRGKRGELCLEQNEPLSHESAQGFLSRHDECTDRTKARIPRQYHYQKVQSHSVTFKTKLRHVHT